MLDNALNAIGSLMNTSGPLVYLLAFAGGLLSSFMPCSLSSLPLVIGYVGAGRKDTRTSFKLSVVFAFGMAVTYTIFAVVALSLGSLIGSTSSVWYMVLGALMLLMGLQMLGVFNFIPSTYLQTKNTRRGYLGALISGILSGVFSSPCSTPVLVAVLSMASVSGSLAASVGLILCYALGYSILSVVAGTSVGFVSKLSESKGYAKAAKVAQVILGLAILALGFYMFYEAF